MTADENKKISGSDLGWVRKVIFLAVALP